MDLTIRPYAPDDVGPVRNLYDRVFGPEAGRRWSERFAWQYERNPASRLLTPPAWVAEGDGSVVGYLAGLPNRVKVGSHETVALYPCDLMVSPEARGQGLAARLWERYLDAVPELAPVSLYAPATGRLCARLGYDEVAAIPVRMRVLSPRRFVTMLSRTGRLPGGRAAAPLWSAAGTLGALPVAALNGMTSPSGRRRSVHSVTSAGEEFDALWETVSPQIPVLAVRDREFVQWRFVDTPAGPCELLAARDDAGTLTGYLALSHSDVSGTTVARVQDLFADPSDGDTVCALLAAAIRLARARSAAAIVSVGLAPGIRRHLRRGLYARRGPEYPALIRWTGDAALRPLLTNPDHWHLTYADGDEGFSV